MIEETCTGSARREKHLDLSDAINGIDGILQHLEELSGRIQGPRPMPECFPEEKEAGLYLADVLNNAADVIREKTSQAHASIDQINKLLF